jgi:dTDP-4-amino-4,6-dideoxy-D-galactose acyltransferase
MVKKPPFECLTAFEALPWDTSFFGMGVARITHTSLDDGELAQVLEHLRSSGVRLAYWLTDAGRRCAGLAGTKTEDLGHKVSFGVSLTSSATKGIASDDLESVPPGRHDTELQQLAIASGELSRFAIDPNFPRHSFEALYAEWMRKSLTRELADDVLVTRIDGSIAGVVTVNTRCLVGEIGLLAVSSQFRGTGLGRRLVEGALRWFGGRGCTHATVVTQEHNIAACRLYQRCGYSLSKRERAYHFWLAPGEFAP